MKKLFKYISFAALLAAVVACHKEQELKDNEKPVTDGVEINIIADGNVAPTSKTAVVDGTIPSVKWLSTDQLTIYEIVDGDVNATTTSTSITLSESDQIANFKATIPGTDPSGASYKYAAVYPASAVSSGSGFYRLTMPDTQHLNGNNFSDDSDILISGLFDHGDSRVAGDENINFSFRRIGTAVKLTLKGITAGEKIKKVVITAPHYIAGRVKYVRETSSLVSDSWHYGAEHQNTITLNVDDLTATGEDVLWFRVLAADKWTTGEELSIEVETDKANYYRNGIDGSHEVITLGKDIDFVDGGLTAFGVGLSVYRVAKPEPVVYTLVELASNIVDDAEYLFVSSDGVNGDKAMGSYNDGSTLYGATNVTVSSKTISITSEVVTVVTLEDAGSDKFYLKVGDNDYLYYTGSKNTVSHGAKGEGDSYKWTVETTGITNVGSSTRKLQYNYNSGNPRFACYTSVQNAVQLYVNLETVLPLGVSFANSSYEFVVNSGDYNDFTGQTVTKSGGVSDDRAVTYTVDSDVNGIVTSINSSTGAVALSGNIGTATIKATVGKKEGLYKAGAISYTITVTPEPITFVKATSIVSGAKYLIIAKYSTNYYMAVPITDGSKSYGYPTAEAVTPLGNGSIQVYNYDNAFTITTSGLGYSIKQADNRYWYSDGSHTSIQIGDTPTSVWTAEKQGDDTYKLMSGSYWIQYSNSYSSFGNYTSTQSSSALPYLYIEDDGSPRLGGTPVVFADPKADVETSTLSTAHLTSVTYKCTSKPDWIESVSFSGDVMEVESKDNKGITSREGVITVKATGTEGNVSSDILVSQAASVFEASSTAEMNFAWDDKTNSTVKSVTISSTYVLTDVANLSISGTNDDKFVASLTRVGLTDDYTLEVMVAEDNESGTDYEAILTVSRDGIDIDIDLVQVHKGGSSPQTSTLNFTAACGGSGTADDGAVWAVTSDGTESNFDSTHGIHYGTSSASVTYVQLETSDITGTVTQVVVRTRDARATATVSVTVGGTAYTCSGSTTATNSSENYTFTGSSSGAIVVKVDRGSSNTKAIYVKSVTVTHQ